MADQYGNLSPEEYQQQQQINRQQKMAQMLMSQTQQPQGQMVSGRFVAPSFFQNILPLVNMYQGQRLAEQADTKAAALAQKLRTDENTGLQNLLNISKGTPAVMPEIKRDDMGNVMPPVEQARPASQEDLIMAAAKLRDPSIRNMLVSERFKPKAPLTVASGASVLQQNADNSFTPVYTNPKAVDLSSKNQQAAEVLGLPLDSSKWSPAERQAVQQFVLASDKNNRPVTSVTVPVSVTTQRAYGQEFGGLIAKQDIDKYTVAQTAPKILQQSTQIKDLISKGAFTGTGSDFALSAAKAFNVAGVDNKDKIRNTELLVSSLGQNVLNNIKTSGLGAGQGFTDKDRQFLERVVGGQIGLDKNTIVELANLQEKVAKTSMSQWNDRFKTMPKEVIQATGITPVYMPLNTNPKDVFGAADAIIGK
jgi:hypothetical protein